MDTELLVGKLILMADVVAIIVLADVAWILWQMLLPSNCVNCVTDGKPQW